MAEFTSADYFARRLSDIQARTALSPRDQLLADAEKAKDIARQLELEQASNRKAQELEDASLVNRMGLDSDGVLGESINLGVNVASGISDIARNALTTPQSVRAQQLNASIPQAAKDAYARKLLGKNTVEDDRILGLRVGDTFEPKFPDSYKKLQESEVRGLDGRAVNTNLAQIERYNEAIGMNKKVRETMDISGLIHRGNQAQQEATFREGFQDNMPTLYEGYEKVGNGDVMSGLGDMLSGVAGLAGTVAKGAVTHPLATAELVAQNAPQLLIAAAGKVGMAATNIPYAIDAFSQGLEEYKAKNKGALPTNDEVNVMAAKAVGLAVAETLGDKIELGGKLVNDAAKAAKKSIVGGADEVVDAATKKGFAAMLKGAPEALTNNIVGRTAVAAGMGASGEFVTEAIQTGLEESIKGNIASAEDVFVGGATGAAGGAGLSTGFHLPKELTGSTEEQVARREVKAAAKLKAETATKEAITTGDTSAWEDPTKPGYAPDKAVEALAGNAALPDATPEAKKASFEKASKILADLSDEIDGQQGLVDSGTEATIRKNIADAESMLNSTNPETAELARDVLASAKEDLANLPNLDRGAVKAAKAKLSQLQEQHKAATVAMSRFNVQANAATVDLDTEIAVVKDATAAPEAKTAAVDRVINLSMAAPERLTTEAAAELASHEATTPKQKTYLESFQAARAAEAAARAAAPSKTMQEVTEEVLVGGKGNIGLAQYRERVGAALAANNEKGAVKELDRLQNFAHHIGSKAEAMTAAWAKGKGTFVQRVGNGFAVATKPLTNAEIKESQAFQVNSPDFVETVAAQADAIRAGVNELESAFDMKFGYAPKVTKNASIPVKPPPSKAPDEPLTQKAHPGTAPAPSPAQSQVAAAASAPVAGAGKIPAVSTPGADASVQSNGLTGSPAPKVDAPVVAAPAADTAVDAKSKTEAQPESQDESVKAVEEDATTEKAKPMGGLSVLDGQTNPEGKLGEIYTTMNKAVAWIKQKTKLSTDTSDTTNSRPLVDVPNFLSMWKSGEVTPQAFFPDKDFSDPKNEHLKGALATFFKAATSWEKDIRDGFIKGGLGGARFLHRDPNQDLVKADGSIDENLATAISFAAFSWFVDAASGPARMKKKEVRKMHGLEEDGEVDDSGYGVLQLVAAFQAQAHNDLGNRVIDALGIEISKDAPLDYKPKLAAALGVHALRLLADKGLVNIRSITGSELNGWLPGYNAQTKYVYNKKDDVLADRSAYMYVEINREDDLTPKGDGRTIKANSANSQNIVAKMFGSQRLALEAQWEPSKFSQKFAKRTKQKVPKKLAKVLNEAQQVPNRIIPKMWEALSALGDDVVLQAAGHIDMTAKQVQFENRAGVEAQNENLITQLREMKAMIEDAEKHSDLGINQPFYAQFEVWKNFRVGVVTRNLNLQSSKIHRFMFARPEWESTIPLGLVGQNTDEENSYLVAVAQAFGIKVDQKSRADVLAQLAADLKDDPSIEKAARALESGTLSAGMKQTIGEFAAAREGMQTLQALVSYGQYLAAKDDLSKPFTTTMMVGVDGKTNGPILSHLALGAGDFGMLNRGGMFSINDGFRNFNTWYSQPAVPGQSRSLDLYEDLASHIVDKIPKGPVFDAIQVITKPLKKGADVSSAGRNLVKKPLTSFAFGAALGTSIRGMQDVFIESVFKRIENVANDPLEKLSSKELIQAINRLLASGGSKTQINENMNISELIERKFTPAERTAMSQAFEQSVGTTVERSMKTYFASYIRRRNSVNKAIDLSFQIYTAVYQDLRAKEIERLIEAGELAVFDKKSGEQVKQHDLTDAQEQALREKVAQFLPRANTAYSDGDLAAGLMMAKHKDRTNQAEEYQAEVQVGKPFRDDRGAEHKKVNTPSITTTETAPGVAGLPYFMHSLDSFIMHMSLRGTDSLNVHDEAGNGVHNVERTAQKINASTWQGMLEFSPPNEAYNMLQRAITQAALLHKAGLLSDDALKVLAKSKQGTFAALIKRARDESYSADLARLTNMSEMAYIDQYTWEGGEYRVTDEDRADAATRKDVLEKTVNPATLTAAKELDALMEAQGENTLDDTSDEDLLNEPVTAADLEVTPVTAPLVAEAAAIKTKLPAARKVADAVRNGQPIGQVLSEMENLDDRAAVTQAVAQIAHNLPPAETPFGALGTSPIASDPDIVALFQKHGTIPVERVIQGIERKLKANPTPENRAMWELLKMVKRTVDPALLVKFITPDSVVADVLEKPADASRGWYVVKGGQEEIYVLSPEFADSGLTMETLLHELVHASLAKTIDFELAQRDGYKDVNGVLHPPVAGYKSDALQLVYELQDLMYQAKKFARKAGITKFDNTGLSNIHEFVSWGMTNRDFQTEILVAMPGMVSKTKENPLRNGMQAFLSKLVSLLFVGQGKSKQKEVSSALAALTGNVSGLFKHAAMIKAPVIAGRTHSMATGTAAANNWDTESIFQALGKGASTVLPTRFQDQLSGVLSDIVGKLHGSGGTFRAALMQNQPLSPLDLVAKAIQTGAAPFAAVLQASPVQATAQESFVMDQVYTTVRAALESGAATRQDIYNELSKLYTEAKGKIKPADFNSGTWSVAAQAKYDFIFNSAQSGADGKSDHLARFAAFGLANWEVNQLLKTPTDGPKTTGGKSFADKIQDIFQKVLGLLSSKITKSVAGESMDANLRSVLDQLVTIEVKYQLNMAKKANANPNLMDLGEKNLKKLADGTRKRIEQAGNWASGSKNPFIAATGAVTATVAGHRTEYFLKALRGVRDQEFQEKDGVLASILTEIQGLPRMFQALVQAAKQNEQRRKQLMTGVSQATMAAFDAKTFAGLSDKVLENRKAAVTNVFMRTGAHHLTGKYSLVELEKLLSDPKELQKEIDAHEAMLAGFGPAQHYYTFQAQALGIFLATGKLPGKFTLMNAHNIAQLAGTPYESRFTEAQKDQAQAVLEKLITLNAIQQQTPDQLSHAHAVLKAENSRGVAENGVEFLLAVHKQLEQDARERLFSDEQVHMMHGYTAEIYNPNVAVKSAGKAEGADLVNQGYTRIGPISRDVDDPDQDAVALYVLKDGGMPHLLTGALSYTGENARGNTLHSGYMNTRTADGLVNAQKQFHIDHARQQAIRDMFKPGSKANLANVTANHMAPVLNRRGEVVNWRYMMSSQTKDQVLQRDNRFDAVMGAIAGSTFDKDTTKDQNRKVLQALKADSDANIATEAKAFLTISPRSTDPEMKEIWNMLPDDTKAAARQIFGTDQILVRTAMIDAVFGYHKHSAANVFRKADEQRKKNIARVGQGLLPLDEIGLFEGIFKDVVELLLEGSYMLRGHDADEARDYARRAAYFVTKSERVWQELVKETKDLLVIKTGVVLMGNIFSNHSLLTLSGVPQKDIIANQLVAMKAATAYQRNTAELDKIELMLNTGYTQGGAAELVQRAAELRDAITRNPVKKLIDAGLMPSIVEDITGEDDLYSYKSAFTRKVESATSRINPKVMNVAKQVYMTHDTSFYQGMSRITQLSDFVARYTLYQHLTQNQKMSHDDAVKKASDAFVVYDNPMHKSLQYLDDMGIFFFTKYFMRIQKVLLELARDNPARVLTTMLFGNFLNVGSTVLDSSFIQHFGNNPFHSGPLEFIENLDRLATVSTSMALLK